MERAAFVIYMIVVVLSVCLFGAMHTYVYTIMSLGILTATSLVFLRSIRKDYKTGHYRFLFLSTGMTPLLFSVWAFLLIQIIPLPDFIVRFLSPESVVLASKSLPASTLTGGDMSTDSWITMAPYVYPVSMSLVRFGVYGLFFLGLVQVLNSKKRIDFAIFLLVAVGCFEVLYGMSQTYSGSYKIWWYTKMNYRSDVTGTYINRNHFAGFMAMGVLLAAAFATALSPRKKKREAGSGKKRSLRSRISLALSWEEQSSKRILILFSGIVLGIGLIFSASRGGMIAAAGAMFLMGLLCVFRQGYRRNGFIMLFLFMSIFAYAVIIGVEHPLERFRGFHSDLGQREKMTVKTLELFEDYKIAGVGVGNFQYAYPRFQAEEYKGQYVRFAHNDWAQYLAEGGIVGMGLLVAGIAYFIFRVMRLWARRTEPYAVCLGVMPVVVLAYIAVHSYSDFNLHVPANFLVLVAIMAIGYAALHLERHHRREKMNYRYYNLPMKYRGGVVLVLILGLIGWSGWWSIRHFMGEVYCHTVPNSTLNRDENPPVEELVKAIWWDPSNAKYYYKLGIGLRNADFGLRNVEKTSTDYADYAEKKKQDQKEIIGAFERAVELNPFDAQYHLQLGWEYAHQWKEKDYHTRWLPAADISMDRAGYFAGVKNPHLLQELGNYWIMRSKSVLPNNPLHHEAWAKACWHYKKAIKIEGGGRRAEVSEQGKEQKKQRPESKELKRMKKEIREYVWNSYPDEEMVNQCVNQ